MTISIVGSVYGRLTVLTDDEIIIRPSGNVAGSLCSCDCGNKTIVSINSLKTGHTSSCGCLQREKASERGRKRGSASAKTYNLWRQMIRRCTDPKDISYENYGAKGVTVCDEWKCFDNFYKDMGDAPRGLQLDRENTSLGYSRENCRWVTPMQNSNNKSNNVRYTVDGENLTIAELSRKYGVNVETLRTRLRKGMPVEVAVLNIKFGGRRSGWVQALVESKSVP